MVLFVYYKIMIVSFYLVVFIINEYFMLVFLREVRDIICEVVEWFKVYKFDEMIFKC